MASTLGMRTTISPRQWQPWTAVSPLLELISMAWPSGQRAGEKPAHQRLLGTRINFLIPPPYACRGRTVLRFPTNRYHLFTVELALNEVLCTRLGSEGSKMCDPTATTCWWAPTMAKPLSVAATAWVIWLCTCTRSWYVCFSDWYWGDNPVWQTGLPTSVGHQTYHVNVNKLKWEITWTGGLPHLSGLPHLPEVPHLHVNRPWIYILELMQYWVLPAFKVFLII